MANRECERASRELHLPFQGCLACLRAEIASFHLKTRCLGGILALLRGTSALLRGTGRAIGGTHLAGYGTGYPQPGTRLAANGIKRYSFWIVRPVRWDEGGMESDLAKRFASQGCPETAARATSESDRFYGVTDVVLCARGDCARVRG
jgi:hypothetical protein